MLQDRNSMSRVSRRYPVPLKLPRVLCCPPEEAAADRDPANTERRRDFRSGRNSEVRTADYSAVRMDCSGDRR